MRKRFKKKKHACGLRKSHKLGLSNRWKEKDFAAIKHFEKEKRRILSF